SPGLDLVFRRSAYAVHDELGVSDCGTCPVDDIPEIYNGVAGAAAPHITGEPIMLAVDSCCLIVQLSGGTDVDRVMKIGLATGDKIGLARTIEDRYARAQRYCIIIRARRTEPASG